MAAQQAALRRSSSGEQLQPAVVPAPGLRGLEPDHLGERAALRVERAVGQRLQLAAEQVEIAARAGTPGRCRGPRGCRAGCWSAAARRRARRPARAASAQVRSRQVRVEHAERQPSDRAGDAAAVGDQLVEGLVLLAADVHLAAVDELAEGSERDRQPPRGVVEGDQHGVVGVLVRRGRPQPVRPRAGAASPRQEASRRRCRRCGARRRTRRTARCAWPVAAAGCPTRSCGPAHGLSAHRPGKHAQLYPRQSTLVGAAADSPSSYRRVACATVRNLPGRTSRASTSKSAARKASTVARPPAR